METTDKKHFNKFAKLTIWTAIAATSFLFVSSYVVDSDMLWDIILFPLQSWGGWFLADVLFTPFYYGAIALLVLVPILGSIASVQTHQRGERGGVIALLLTGAALVFIIGALLVYV